VAGAYVAGSATIKQLENSFFSFLEDFQDNDEYMGIMSDKEYNPQFANFLVIYAWDLMVLALIVFWHVAFIILLGSFEAYTIFSKVNELDTANTNDIPVNYGWKMGLSGVMFGATNYMVGQALSPTT